MIWQSFFGYVMIRLDGRGLERFLNKVLQAGIPVWNVRRESAQCMHAELRAKDFARLRPLLRTGRCRVHIIKRRGVPFLLARFSKRKALVVGGAACFLLLLFAQTRVWRIQIEGVDAVPLAVVTRALEQANVKVGMPRKAVDALSVGNAIRSYDKGIAWAGVDMDGVILHVRVVEAQPLPQAQDTSTPSDVIAVKDGIIEKVSALCGKAHVKAGDAVRAGDVLIRGDITREGAAQELLVCAQGQVEALVWYVATVEKAPRTLALVPTGNTCPYRKVLLAGHTLYQSHVPFDECEVEVLEDTRFTGAVLPVRQVYGVCRELREAYVVIEAPEEQMAQALYQAEMEALIKVPQSARIVEKQSEAIMLEEGGVRVTVRVCAREQIGVQRPIRTAAYLD